MYLPEYTHIVKQKLKHIYLSFDDDGNLIIKSPKVSQKQIEQLLIKKSSWINKSRAKIEKKKGKKVNFSTSMKLYFLGRAYPLLLQPHTKKHTKLTFNEERFTLFYATYDESVFQKHIDRFYKQEAINYIPAIVSLWADKMSLKPKDIRFRKTKRQWGSCTALNVLSFNTMIMKLPNDVIQYVIVHELSHIVHKHHQKMFWQLVERYIPDYKSHIEELKRYTT